MKPRNLFLMVMIAVALTCAMTLLFACGDDDDDDDDSAYLPAGQCNIDDSGLEKIGGRLSGNSCNDLGVNLVVDEIWVNELSNVQKVVGRYAIDNENAYYLRGLGLEEDYCLERIYGAGSFEVLVRHSQCTQSFKLDLVTSEDPEANAFCTFSVLSELDCGFSTDDDDFIDDEDDDDDFNPNCDYIAGLTWVYECGYVLVDANSNEMSLSEAIDDCNNCVGDCANAYMGDDDCDGFADCAVELCF